MRAPTQSFSQCMHVGCVTYFANFRDKVKSFEDVAVGCLNVVKTYTILDTHADNSKPPDFCSEVGCYLGGESEP